MAILVAPTGWLKLLDSGVPTAFSHASAVTDLAGTEATGVTRQATAWAAAASNNKATNAGLTIPVGAANNVIGVGLFDAATAGNLTGIAAIGTAAQLYGVGTVLASSDVITSNAHGLANADRIAVGAAANEALPTGLSATTLYFVVGSTTNTFQLSLTSGGAAVDVTTDGELFWMRTVVQAFTLSGNLTVASGQLTIVGKALGS
ncbi:MAG: hypothetical protein RJA49_2049 [Actinomycetota bacterium]